MADIRSVLINPISPNRPAKRFQLGTQPPVRTDGLGGWQEVPRERRKALTEYIGAPIDKLDLTLMLDGFPSTSVQPDLDWLFDLGRRGDGTRTPTFKITGPVYLSGDTLIMAAAPDLGPFWRRDTDGTLVRQEITLHCWKYNSADTDVISSPAKAAKANSSSGSTTTSSSGPSHPKTYTVKAGDTLQTIAARFYGDASQWHQIADANGIRDPVSLKTGSTLKLP